MTESVAAAAPPDHDAPTFRPIQYMGSKARLLPQIGAAIDSVDPGGGTAIDLFSGSGVVAAYLGRSRPVTAVDVQEYARVLASALAAPARMSAREIEELTGRARELTDGLDAAVGSLVAVEEEALGAFATGIADTLCEILEHGSVVARELGGGPGPGRLADALDSFATAPPPAPTLTRFYGGVYFGYRQALELDCILAAARELGDRRSRDTAIAAALGAASECVTSVGSHFAQPVRPRDREGRPKSGTLAAVSRRRARDVCEVFAERLRSYAEAPGAAYPVCAERADYRSFLASPERPVSVVYADPPYTRDHYSRFYHVLETMARGDDPDVSRVNVGGGETLSRGLYRRDRHQSPFCIRSQARGAFRELFAGVSRLGAPLVLSYSPYTSGTAARPQPRLLRIAELAQLAEESFADVAVRSGGELSHSRFNARRLNGRIEREAEVLLVCVP